MGLKACILFSFALFFLLSSKGFSEASGPAKAPTTPPPPPPPSSPTTPATPPPPSKLCVGPCWDRCHNIKAKNIRPCMILCTRCCMKCGYVIPPTCTNWSTVTIEGYTYQCP